MICKAFLLEISVKLEIIDMVCAMRSFVTINEDNIKEWVHSDACEVRFLHMIDIVNAAAKEKGAEEGGECQS
jgi:hypothetical protein